MIGSRPFFRRAVCIAVAMLFAVSATLYVATVLSVAGTIDHHGAAAASQAADHAGCHGAADDDPAPGSSTRMKSCCDLACHAWMPPPTIDLPPRPPAVPGESPAVASVKAGAAAGIDRPPRRA